MELLEWVSDFRALNERVRRGEKLRPEEGERHRQGSLQLARLVVAAQRLTAMPGERTRLSLRVAWPHPVELRAGADTLQATTLDLSRGGFSALFAKAPPVHLSQRLAFRLELGDENAPLMGMAVVRGTFRRHSAHRTALSFASVDGESLKRLEALILDTLLDQFRFWLGDSG